MIRSCIKPSFTIYSKFNDEHNKYNNNKKKLLKTKLTKLFVNCDITKTKYNRNECLLLETEIDSLYTDIENDANIDLVDFYKTFGLELLQFNEDIKDI